VQRPRELELVLRSCSSRCSAVQIVRRNVVKQRQEKRARLRPASIRSDRGRVRRARARARGAHAREVRARSRKGTSGEHAADVNRYQETAGSLLVQRWLAGHHRRRDGKKEARGREERKKALTASDMCAFSRASKIRRARGAWRASRLDPTPPRLIPLTLSLSLSLFDS